MTLRTKSRKILIPDCPPRAIRRIHESLIIASIGAFCATVVAVALLFVFLGA